MSTYEDRQKLLERAEKIAKDVDEDFLDESVHDVKNQEASSINNQGVRAQAEFLIDEMGQAEFEEFLVDIETAGQKGPK